MNSCLFIGRFQPFHNGHLMVVQGMRRVCSRIIIGIGGPDGGDSSENPFTLAERHEMIGAALLEANVPEADILDCPDTPTDTEWVNSILKIAGPVDTVWTGNELVEQLFTAKNIKVQKIKEIPGLSATEIRRQMKEGGDWEKKTPDAVVEVIKRIGGIERIKNLA